MSAWGKSWGKSWGASWGAIDTSAAPKAAYKTQLAYIIGDDEDQEQASAVAIHNNNFITLVLGLAAAGVFE